MTPPHDTTARKLNYVHTRLVGGGHINPLCYAKHFKSDLGETAMKADFAEIVREYIDDRLPLLRGKTYTKSREKLEAARNYAYASDGAWKAWWVKRTSRLQLEEQAGRRHVAMGELTTQREEEEAGLRKRKRGESPEPDQLSCDDDDVDECTEDSATVSEEATETPALNFPSVLGTEKLVQRIKELHQANVSLVAGGTLIWCVLVCVRFC
ncbi:uncharacterized protein EV422DRAFT_230184 [Fimicolochytrium jonesii]|uniref:uncharacterized protein n=1 Tax=Fimicolochytrium jonesii TaxID=1396493 RepID=UPI0022FE3372|nr:uncharacterized protein EV422DRAFT_230184 [Fimicolochytrium jonesii]KAI8817280.1 hypothetical protein EV422DRAFT_230184 [Fimicolochytrium jonesii]